MSLTINNRYRITPVFPMWNHDKGFHGKESRRSRLRCGPSCAPKLSTVRRFLPFLMRRDSLEMPGDEGRHRPAHPANNLYPQSRKGLPGEVKHGEVVGISSGIAAGDRQQSGKRVRPSPSSNTAKPRRRPFATPNSYIPSKARGAILEPCPELLQASPIPINVGGVDYGPAPDTGELGMNIDIWL